MRFELVRLKVDLRLKDNKLLLKALALGAQEVLLLVVQLERIVVDIVLLLPALAAAVADVAAFMPVAAVRIQLVVVVEALLAEPALGMPAETGLVDGSGMIVTKALMLPQLTVREQLMLMCKDLLVLGTELTL